MADIGATLREARVRARIDISEIEAETKIRAKYLRALENEEWDLLPGPTYVKTFLRTYAEALGLDARLLVEEYKLRHERLTGDELARPIGPPTGGRMRATPPGIPRGAVVSLIVVLLLATLFVLGKLSGGGDKGTAGPAAPASTTKRSATQPPASSATGTKTPAVKPTTPSRGPRAVSLQIVPTAPVNVCLAAKGRGILINAVTLQPGQPSKTFRSTRFRIVLGNNGARLKLGGRSLTVPASSGPIGYEITRAGRTPLSVAARPACG